MSSIKCPHCGFVQFPADGLCKLCKKELGGPARDAGSPLAWLVTVILLIATAAVAYGISQRTAADAAETFGGMISGLVAWPVVLLIARAIMPKLQEKYSIHTTLNFGLMIGLVVQTVMSGTGGMPKLGPGARLEMVTLIEGRGVEPDMIIGTTTLSQARAALGRAAGEVHTSGIETSMSAGPLQLTFINPQTGSDPVLYAIRTVWIPNPNYPFPKWKGKTSRSIGLLDSAEKLLAAYGQPATDWHSSGQGRFLYYPNGMIVTVEHPSRISNYEGPAPTDSSANVVAFYITPPFQILEHSRPVHSGGMIFRMPPKTSLIISP